MSFFPHPSYTSHREKHLQPNQYPSDVTLIMHKAEKIHRWCCKFNEKNTFHSSFDRHLICQPSTSVTVPAQLETHFILGTSESDATHPPTVPPRFMCNWLKQLEMTVRDTREFHHPAGSKASSAIKHHSSILSRDVAVRPSVAINKPEGPNLRSRNEWPVMKTSALLCFFFVFF